MFRPSFMIGALGCRSVAFFMAGVVAMGPASALTLKLDYSYDAAEENFFGRFPEAKAAIEQAAADLSGLITSVPTGISNDYFLGASGSAEVIFDLDLRYRDPSTGVMRQVDMVDPSDWVAEGEVIMYLGSRLMPENTLAFSEISTVKNTMFANVAGSATDMQAATGIAASDAELIWRRGADGPVFNTLSGPVNLAGTTVNFMADMGPIAASVWFDSDTNNNGDPDTNSQLAAFWHFDHTTPPPPDKFDFYSAALHELAHGLGLGTAESYNQLFGISSGQPFWLGSAAQSLNGGSPFYLANADGRHLMEGLMSPRLTDGVMQEVLLDPTIQPGVRKGLTLMDAAFLQDIGWSLSVPIPEPGTLVCLGFLLGLRRRRPGV